MSSANTVAPCGAADIDMHHDPACVVGDHSCLRCPGQAGDSKDRDDQGRTRESQLDRSKHQSSRPSSATREVPTSP